MKSGRHVFFCLMIFFLTTVTGFASMFSLPDAGQYIDDSVMTSGAGMLMPGNTALVSDEINVKTLEMVNHWGGFLMVQPGAATGQSGKKPDIMVMIRNYPSRTEAVSVA